MFLSVLAYMFSELALMLVSSVGHRSDAIKLDFYIITFRSLQTFKYIIEIFITAYICSSKYGSRPTHTDIMHTDK